MSDWRENLERQAGPPEIGSYWKVMVYKRANTSWSACYKADSAHEAIMAFINNTDNIDSEDSWLTLMLDGTMFAYRHGEITQHDVDAWYNKYGGDSP